MTGAHERAETWAGEAKSAMKITYFSKTTAIGPSSRYRIYQYRPYLQARGIDVQVCPLFGPGYFRLLTWRAKWARAFGKVVYAVARFLSRLRDLLSLGPADLVVIEGQLFPYCPPIVERLLARRYRFLLELDDAIYLTPRHERKIPELLRLSSGAIVGNATLAEYARAYTSKVYVVPTVVDTDRFRPADGGSEPEGMPRGGGPVIAWIGLAFNFPHVEMLLPVFLKLQQEHGILVRVISSDPPALPGVRMDFRPWSFETEVADLQSCDIGIMPLMDTEWARGKCGLKLLQYMAVGKPAVASPVGVNRDIIRDGENGLFAATQEDWYRQLSRLCRDAELRTRLGESARRTVELRYSLKQWGPRLAAQYRTIVGGDDRARSEASALRPTAP